MRKVSPWVLTLLACVSAGGAAYAENHAKPEGSAQPAGAELCPMNDAARLRSALIAIHNANRDEIALGKLAQDRAESPDVKQFATMMVRDHSTADRKLVDLAKHEKIDLTLSSPQDPVRAAMGDASRALETTLSNLKGARFDVAYLAPQVPMHDLALNIIDEGAKVATRAEMKDYLTTTRQTVSEHRDHAMELQNRLALQPTPVGGGPAEAPSAEAPRPSAAPSAAPSSERPKAPSQRAPTAEPPMEH